METISHYLLTFLINSLWQVPLVTVVAALVARAMRNSPAKHRNVLWVAALAAALLLPLASVKAYKPTNSSERMTLRPTAPALPAIATPVPPALRPAPRPAPTSAPKNLTVPVARATSAMLLTAYLLFLLFRLARLLNAGVRTVRIRRASAPAERSALLNAVWKRSAHALGVHDVELRISTEVPGPLMAGAWRKIIVLPESLLREQSEDVLTTAIGHEMAHIARHDFALNVVYELLFLPIAFHPAVIVIRRGIERTRELACDELVTRSLINSATYARSIMSIAAGIAHLPRPGYTLGVFDGDILEERIKRLLNAPAANLLRARLLLATGLTALAACMVIASGLSITARAQSRASSEMKIAGEAYNNGDFKTAIQHFEYAAQSEPSNINAKLFLANALLREYHSEEAHPDSRLIAEARRQYNDVLARDARNKLALQGLIAIDMQTRQLADTRQWIGKLIEADPNDAAGYYTAGALDWATAYPEFSRAKQAAGMRMDEYVIPDPEWRKRLRDQIMPQIDDGFRMLNTALQLDPNYSDAMAYMNLLDRLKAGIVDDAGESAALIADADTWVGKAIAAKRNAQNTQPVRSQLNLEGPPPGPPAADAVAASAPPPPPPPPPPPAPGSMADKAADRPASASEPPIMRRMGERSGSFWQVTGAADVSARELVRMLRDKGFHASLLTSTQDNEPRVIAGPYDTASLQQAKAALESAGFNAVRTW